jgi:hypothetical protein
MPPPFRLSFSQPPLLVTGKPAVQGRAVKDQGGTDFETGNAVLQAPATIS